MKIRFILQATTLGMLACSGLANAALDAEPVVFKSGEWSVHRSTDSMTDEISCTGIYKEEYGIQLTDDALYISVRGGLKGITLRFGDQPVDSLRLPRKMEEQIDVIMIENNDFTRLLGSNRLRAQAMTVLGSIRNYDIDLKGISAAVKNIRSGCPGDPVKKTLSRKPSLCGDKVIKRLRSKNVDAAIIKYACSSD